jgi:hypothetical protein
MSVLCLHSGAHLVPREELFKVPVPNATKSYCPVEHFKLIDSIEQSATSNGHIVESVEVGIQDAKRGEEFIPGAKMFGIMRLKSEGDTGGDNLRLDIGIRNSYDKSIAVGIAAGASVFVCDNMMITGEVQAVRKHTPNVWQDVFPMINAVMAMANKQHELDQQMRDTFKGIGMGTQAGLDVLGCMAAHGHLSYAGGGSSMFALAIREWLTPSFEEFHGRDVWSLYNATTFGTKKSTLSNAMLDNAKATLFFRDRYAYDITESAQELNEDLNELRQELQLSA